MSSSNKKLTFGKRIESFKYAIEGMLHLIRQEPNVRIHIIAAIAAVICGWYLDINKNEWLVIIVCIGIVFTTEIINTAIENICDYISPTQHHKIKIIKDLAAAAVLVSAIMSVVVASCIFLPKLLAIL
ncbi:diacylglycerol kinase family protein [Sphingobacterium phlebotomi]|uniref:Diacylglycerol kinase family protein n=1 Tax=Sphingobacterium phlebotomi TaxID=2605433 RepID=A0A5D4H4Z4_9SPHI|nr:diacylglycerol kinase family protein [Sphingobacterium phlebotomi]TYR35362.1 diacylglycerol kinase family protein [Sphingobacterium phlebotomi]